MKQAFPILQIIPHFTDKETEEGIEEVSPLPKRTARWQLAPCQCSQGLHSLWTIYKWKYFSQFQLCLWLGKSPFHGAQQKSHLGVFSKSITGVSSLKS